LNGAGRTAGVPGGRRARRWLVGIEVAVASALVSLSVVLSLSFARLQSVDPGFRPDHLLTVRLSLPRSKYPNRAAVVRFAENLRPALRALPGVVDASPANVVPLNGYRATADFWPADRPAPLPRERPEAHYRMIGPSYFATFGVPVIEGRGIDEHDTDRSESVVLINRVVAERFWPGRSPVGDSLLLTDSGDDTIRRARIVGVTGNVKHFGLETESTPDVYVAIPQVPEGTVPWLMNNMYWGVRTTVAPESIRDEVRRAIRRVDPDVPASTLRTMDEALAIAVGPRVLNLWLVRIFAGAALSLALAGVYAVTAFGVAERTREIGIRSALGARPGENVRVMVCDALTPIALGLAAGAGVSIAIAPALRAALFEINPFAPGPIVAVSALLFGAGAVAATSAAWRVRSIDPIVALGAD
jgi:predicted permease